MVIIKLIYIYSSVGGGGRGVGGIVTRIQPEHYSITIWLVIVEILADMVYFSIEDVYRSIEIIDLYRDI